VAHDAVVETRGWYRDYYAARGADRNDFLSNPGVLQQELAVRRALLDSLRWMGAGRDWWIYVIGCGGGSTLVALASLWFRPERLRGIDIIPERIADGKQRFPFLNLECGDAKTLPASDHSYDLVMSSTMFVQITDDAVAARIASEMARVARRHILLIDWRYDGGRAVYKALDRARIARLFPTYETVHETPGALLPPIGRSRIAAPFYPLLQRLFPPLVGQVATVLRRYSSRG